MKKTTLKLIDALRNSDMYIEHIFTKGGCYQFHLFLKKIFSNAIPYINENKDHVITRIGDCFYDINGVYKDYSKYIPLTNDDKKIAEQWSFSRQQMLKINECEACGEPFIYIPNN
jgi:hypothetical protein